MRESKGGKTTYSVVEAGDLILIRKRRRGVHKRKPRLVTKIPVPPKGGAGCRLAAILYDQELDRTTFMYECDHVVNRATGASSYTVTRSGRLDGF